MTEPLIPSPYTAALLLGSGEIFYGYGVGAPGTKLGELCFNTGMTGYQETLTDPSYCAQVITFTFPHIGNVGANKEDMESAAVSAAGLIVREAITPDSNYRSLQDLQTWLYDQHVTGISGIDTRALTRLVRLRGVQNVAILYPASSSQVDIEAVRVQLNELPPLKGMELARRVTSEKPYGWTQGEWRWNEGFSEKEQAVRHVVAIDYGEKYNIMRSLVSFGCKVTVVPAATPAADILAMKPDGVFLSNGPGDPAATGRYALPILHELLGSGVPMFGICLGHQLLALAVGAETEKMHQGHRGANQPVQRLSDGAVEITSQNHGFVVNHGSLPECAVITHLSLFDGTIEGFELTDRPAFAVQYHPESSPGPHDSRYLFARFVSMIDDHLAAA